MMHFYHGLLFYFYFIIIIVWLGHFVEQLVEVFSSNSLLKG